MVYARLYFTNAHSAHFGRVLLNVRPGTGSVIYEIIGGIIRALQGSLSSVYSVAARISWAVDCGTRLADDMKY